MGHLFNNASTSLNASTACDELTNTVRIDVRGNLDQASRPSLVQLIQDLRSRGIQSHVTVDLSQAARVESSALAGLRTDLNAMEAASGTAGGVSLVLTGEKTARQPQDTTEAPLLEITEGLDDEFAAAFEGGSRGSTEQSFMALPARPLEQYSDDELYAASDAVFSLLDDPGTLGGPDLLGRYNDIGQEIVRRTALGEILDPAAESRSVS